MCSTYLLDSGKYQETKNVQERKTNFVHMWGNVSMQTIIHPQTSEK